MSTQSALSAQSATLPSAQRINRSLTAAAEKCALVWMARHAPRWLTSDQLTVLGFTAQIAAGLLFALARYDRRALILAIVCIVLNWFGDSMDGTLARVRSLQRPRYGYYVDHIVDIFGAVALMCGLGCSGFLHWQTAMAMLIAFLVLAAESYLAAYSLSCFQISQGIFGPTEIRILLIAGSLALMRSSYVTVLGHRMLLFDLAGAIAAAGMSGMAVLIAIQHIAQLYRQEPLP